MTNTADLLIDARALLGEGPLYCPNDHTLLWVDIPGHLVHRLHLSRGVREEMSTGEAVGAVVSRARGGFLFALRGGFAVVERFGDVPSMVAAVEPHLANNRLNDGKCDRAGRFYAGSMSDDEAPGAGTLYRFDAARGVDAMCPGVTVSNGLAWNDANTQMYYIDSKLARVDVFDYDASDGNLTNRRVLFEVPAEHGIPDGMTLDDSGCLWIAHWGGGAVRRYTPSGVVDQTIVVPASLVTSCAFGGSDHAELFITTASVGQSPEQRARQPYAGGVFVARPGVRGAPAHRFAG